MTASERRGFHHAKAAAEMSDFTRAKVGCAVMDKNKVLSVGFNTTKTHPQQKHYNQLRTFRDGTAVAPAQLHAEMAAVLQLQYADVDWSRADVYVYRLCKDRPHGMARPCPACMGMLKDLGVKRVFYTSDIGVIREEVS